MVIFEGEINMGNMSLILKKIGEENNG